MESAVGWRMELLGRGCRGGMVWFGLVTVAGWVVSV